jgi:DNA-binding transcriptional ArsR family regulator
VKSYAHPSLKDIALPLVMQALSDPCRLAIVRELARSRKREVACGEIPLKISKATRSHHFDVLRDAGLIATRSEGTKCMTSLRIGDLNRRFPGLIRLIIASGKPVASRESNPARGR